jgi:hypothetical protein
LHQQHGRSFNTRVADFRREDGRSADQEAAAALLPAHTPVEQAGSQPADRGRNGPPHQEQMMSLFTLAVANAALAGAILGALALVLWLPYLLARFESSATVAAPDSVPLAA